MRVAMPVWCGRIAPLFDVARHLLVWNVENGRTRSEVHVAEDLPSRRTAVLADAAADVLICGGISAVLKERVEASGTEVICWIKGEPQQVLRAFLHDDLHNPRFEMPGHECPARAVAE